jgi:hypothetical protein
MYCNIPLRWINNFRLLSTLPLDATAVIYFLYRPFVSWQNSFLVTVMFLFTRFSAISWIALIWLVEANEIVRFCLYRDAYAKEIKKSRFSRTVVTILADAYSVAAGSRLVPWAGLMLYLYFFQTFTQWNR